jgi:hypothetical protein
LFFLINKKRSYQIEEPNLIREREREKKEKQSLIRLKYKKFERKK